MTEFRANLRLARELGIRRPASPPPFLNHSLAIFYQSSPYSLRSDRPSMNLQDIVLIQKKIEELTRLKKTLSSIESIYLTDKDTDNKDHERIVNLSVYIPAQPNYQRQSILAEPWKVIRPALMTYYEDLIRDKQTELRSLGVELE